MERNVPEYRDLCTKSQAVSLLLASSGIRPGNGSSFATKQASAKVPPLPGLPGHASDSHPTRRHCHRQLDQLRIHLPGVSEGLLDGQVCNARLSI